MASRNGQKKEERKRRKKEGRSFSSFLRLFATDAWLLTNVAAVVGAATSANQHPVRTLVSQAFQANSVLFSFDCLLLSVNVCPFILLFCNLPCLLTFFLSLSIHLNVIIKKSAMRTHTHTVSRTKCRHTQLSFTFTCQRSVSFCLPFFVLFLFCHFLGIIRINNFAYNNFVSPFVRTEAAAAAATAKAAKATSAASMSHNSTTSEAAAAAAADLLMQTLTIFLEAVCFCSYNLE